MQYLQSKALRKYLKVPKDVTGVVVTEVAPLATKAALASGAKTFLQEHDVITHIDGRTIGDDYTVRLRNDELLKVSRWCHVSICACSEGCRPNLPKKKLPSLS